MDKSRSLNEIIRAHVLKVLREFQDVSESARQLKISRTTLYSYIERYNLRQEWRDGSDSAGGSTPEPGH